MSVLKSISAFLAAAAVTASVGVGYAQGVKGTNQDLPELGSPANAAISIEDEYRAGLSYVNEIRNTGRTLLKTLNLYSPPGYTKSGDVLPSAKP